MEFLLALVWKTFHDTLLLSLYPGLAQSPDILLETVSVEPLTIVQSEH